MVSDRIDLKNLYHYNNVLECICLLATGNEFENGLMDHFVENIHRTSVESLKALSTIDFKLITSNQHHHLELGIEKYFKSFEHIMVYVPQKLDHYYETEYDLVGPMPKLGLKSGPNYVFFEVIKTLREYNTTLMLECDTFFSRNWFREINGYVEHANGFWVSGSLYYGKNGSDIYDTLNTHINGGVCLYATGCSQFQIFMDFCYSELEKYVSFGIVNLPYDFLIKMVIDDQLKNKERNAIAQFINQQYVSNKLIVNYSARSDRLECNQEIERLYNYSLLHKKLS